MFKRWSVFLILMLAAAFPAVAQAPEPPPIQQLDPAYVRANNSYIKTILRKLDQSLAVNDPDNGPDWTSRVYTKIELDATRMEEIIKLGVLEKNIGFVREHIDTSEITGQSFIPVLFSENLSDVYHSEEPSFNREVMIASRISGFEEDNSLRQFTGTYLLKTNFYKSGIGVLNLSIPNPASASAHFLYNYYLADSLEIEGRKTYALRFHPKKLVTSPALDGEFLIDAQDFGIRSVHASLSASSNVKWIRHFRMDIVNRRMPDGRWFPGHEKLFIDFSVTPSENSPLVSLLGHRNTYYGEPQYAPLARRDELSEANPVVMRDVIRGDDAYWASVRPVPLTEHEQGIYDMVARVQASSFYRWTYFLLESIISGYIEIPSWHFEFGRWARTFSKNELEGFRVQLGGRTLYTMSEKVRLGGYVAYGFKDKKLKWNAQAEVMLGRERTRKLTVTYKRDFEPLGSGNGVFSVPNMFSSVLSPAYGNRQTLVHKADVLYQHEFIPEINAEVQWTSLRMWSNPNVPIYATDGSRTILESLAVNQLHLGLRLSLDERVNRNYFRKTYLYTRYPVLVLGITGAFKGITPGDIGFVRSDAVLKWKVPTTFLGYGNLYLNGGAIWGTVPHTLLKLHEGNSTYFVDKSAFSCMAPYEFASDRWLQGYYEHNFNGFFLGKIPFIKELDLREMATVRFAWGSLSEQNQANTLPETTTLTQPYVEAGFGISNILRVLRVDFFWRVTHRSPEPKRNFSVNVGIDLDF